VNQQTKQKQEKYKKDMMQDMDDFMGFTFFEGENQELEVGNRVSSPETTDGSSSTSGDEPAFTDFIHEADDIWRPIPFDALGT